MILRFEDCVLNNETRTLWRNGAPLRLQPKVMDLLIVLAENRMRVVSKPELYARLWGDGACVGSASLPRLVRELRKVLGDDSLNPRLIRTLHSRGYQFIADVRCPEPMPVAMS